MNKTDSILNFFIDKIRQQDNIPTFFDNFVFYLLENGYNDRQNILNFIIESKIIRFLDFEDRIKKVKFLSTEDYRQYTQGVHSVTKWKGMNMFKSCVDLSVYTMLIDEIKPDIIIEYGSGNGSSAIWLSDMCVALGLKTKVISYDINRISLENLNVEFINIDLKNLKFDKNDFGGKKLIIEDAHSHVYDTLLKTDELLEIGDYLVIEDSIPKQNIISNFLMSAKNKYVVDNYYVDFFGINSGSFENSIFKVI